MGAPAYPALFDCSTRRLHPLASSPQFLVGRSDDADLCVRNLSCSRKHFRVVRQGKGFFVEALNPDNPTFCDDRQITAGRVELDHGAVLRAGENQFRFLLRPDAATVPPPAPREAPPPRKSDPEPDGFQTIGASPGEVTRLTLERNIAVQGRMVIGRDAGVQIRLNHPQVSRRHALIELRGDGTASLRDLNSANGTFVDGNRLGARPVLLRPGCHIDVGPFALEFAGAELLSRGRASDVELVAQSLCRVVTDRQTRRPLSLLDDITLVFKPREFVCLLGPSGSGKSTLMSILSGRATPDDGAVLLNGQDLHGNFDALKQGIALVPQKNVLHETLSVGRALHYTAKLRLPPDTSATERETCISEILDVVRLSNRRGTVIHQLSGGQVKRASLANEILCKPGLLFLDEVTSGLDEQTDREMMALFRSIAESGKTVVCVTHSLAHVQENCHLVVILTPGGRLAFVGSPREALDYFKIERLGDVYERLGSQPPEHWSGLFQKSPLFARYVTDRLPRRQPSAASGSARRGAWRLAGTFVRQSALLTFRNLAIWRGELLSLTAMLGQSLLVAFLLGVVFGDLTALTDKRELVPRSVNLLFLLAVSSFWFGCNNAAKEIVKERAVFTCERDFNLLSGSYYFSKLLVLATFSVAQTLLLYGLTKWACGPPGAAGGQLMVLLLLSVAGTTLGLLISTFSTSEEMAVTLIPIAIIPQIILSGAIAPLNGLGKWLAMAASTTYWGKCGLDANLPADLKQFAIAHELAEDWTATRAVVVMAIHALAFMAAALVLLALQSRKAALVLNHLKRAVSGG